MKKWAATVRFDFPDGVVSERRFEIEAEDRDQAQQIVLHMAREITRPPKLKDPEGVDFFGAILSLKEIEPPKPPKQVPWAVMVRP